MTQEEAIGAVRAAYPDAVCRRVVRGVYCVFKAPRNKPGGAARLTGAHTSRVHAWKGAALSLKPCAPDDTPA